MLIKIWDLWIRIFHWFLVATIGFLLVSGETGAGFFDWHRLAGEIALGLILFRIVWGLIGSSNARFTNFLVNPKFAITHLRDLIRRRPHQERGHNAAGGWAVVAMLLSILVQAATGLFIADEEGWVEGAFHGSFSSGVSDTLYNVHHINAGILQFIVLLHIVMIGIYFFVGRQNLLMPMITGKIKWVSENKIPDVHFGKFALGLIVAVWVAGTIAYVFGWWDLSSLPSFK